MTSFVISILKEISINRLYKTLIRISRSKYIWSNKYLKYDIFKKEQNPSKFPGAWGEHVDEIQDRCKRNKVASDARKSAARYE